MEETEVFSTTIWKLSSSWAAEEMRRTSSEPTVVGFTEVLITRRVATVVQMAGEAVADLKTYSNWEGLTVIWLAAALQTKMVTKANNPNKYTLAGSFIFWMSFVHRLAGLMCKSYENIYRAISSCQSVFPMNWSVAQAMDFPQDLLLISGVLLLLFDGPS